MDDLPRKTVPRVRWKGGHGLDGFGSTKSPAVRWGIGLASRLEASGIGYFMAIIEASPTKKPFVVHCLQDEI
jgi:hypothetical protein